MSGTAAVSTRATAAMTSTISEQDFKTPDRSTAKTLSSAAGTGSHPEEKKEDALTSNCNAMNNTRPSATLVTPPDSFSTAAANDVRFDGKNGNNNNNTGIEAKTLCSVGSDGGYSSSTSSPTASQRGLVSRRGGRCGSPGRRNFVPSPSTEAKPSKEAADAAAAVLEFKTLRSPERKQNENENSNSISNNDASLAVVKKENESNEKRLLLQKRRPQQPKSSKKATSTNTSVPSKKSSNVTFSPVPTPKANSDKFVKTPTKSPTGRFTSLPTLDDDALGSPGAIFLSPTRTPTYFDRKGAAVTRDRNSLESVSGLSISGNPARSPLTPRTPKRDLDRDRLLSTPTDFAFDYGKPAANGSLLESSNVLAWLHSPTTNDLFSPGGLGSMLNTPRGGIVKAPNTPTFSTSFFFSDVAGLPRVGECASPKSGPAAAASDNEKRTVNGRGNNNIICISPLASYKTKGPNSPKINYKEMFASPAERSGMASLIAQRKAFRAGVQRGGNLDAVHLAERDLMEDEDLSVLLQLASTTPRPSLSVTDQAGGSAKLDGSKVFRKNGENENLPSLQLPIIGGRDADGKGTRLTRKTHSRDHNDDDRGVKPTSQTSNHPAAELKPKSGTETSKKAPTTGSMHPGARSYPPMPPHIPHHDSPYYPSFHPGMAHGGSMRVVVGGPPPNRGKSTSESQRVRTYAVGPRGEYPPPYPPPPSHYSHHRGAPPPPPHIHPHYARYPPHPPPHSHGAPPRHMPPPLYGAHPKSKPTGTSTSSAKKQSLKVLSGKTGSKRPATTSTQKISSKKSKKHGPQKKKNRSPQLVDKAERQKAAATIQAVNQASGGKNDKAAALAAAILRGVTMRPSGKWQAQLYFAGKSRYIGVFDTREKAALAYEIAREKLKSEKSNAEGGVMTPKRTEAAVNAARKAAFEGVNERDPRLAGK